MIEQLTKKILTKTIIGLAGTVDFSKIGLQSGGIRSGGMPRVSLAASSNSLCMRIARSLKIKIKNPSTKFESLDKSKIFCL